MANQMTQQSTIARYLARLGYRSFQTGNGGSAIFAPADSRMA